MGAVKNSSVFKGVSVNGQIAKGLAKNGVVFYKQQTYHSLTVHILARATAIGATPDTDLNKFDTFIRSIADILTTNFDIYFRFRGTGDANFKRINLANPEGTLADFYGGYTLNNSGFLGNGVNAYVDTIFNPSLLVSGQKYQLNDASRMAVIPEVNNSQLISATSISNLYEYWYTSNANTVRINNAASITSAVDLTGSGLKLLSLTGSNVKVINKNIENDKASNPPNILRNATMTILRNGTQFSTNKISSFAAGKAVPFDVSQQLRTAENADMANLGLTQLA